MVKLKYLSFLIISVIILSCSSDDDSVVNDDEQNNGNYLPLVIDNSWNYKNTISNFNGNNDTNNETVSVISEEMVNDTLFFQASSDNPSVNLTSTGILVGGELFKEDNQLFVKGQFDNFGSDIPGGFAVPIEANIFPVYSKTAGSNAELFSESGSYTQTQSGVDLDLNYTLSSKNAGSMNSMEVNGTTYEDVIISTLTLNLEITTTVTQGGIPINVIILSEQDVYSTTHYFANEVGMIKSESVTSFDFEDIPNLNLQDINSTTVQELQTYNIILP